MAARSKTKLFRSVSVVACILSGVTAANAQTFTSADTPLLLPPVGTSGTTISTITVPSVGVISDVDVVIDASHSWVGDLDVSVASPTGTSVTLIFHPPNNAAGAGDSTNLGGNYIFDDDAAADVDIDVVPLGTGVSLPSGSYHPSTTGGDMLADFNGENTAGVWTLTAIDDTGGDSGTLNFWQLIFTLKAIEQAFIAPSLQSIVSGNTRQMLGTLEDRKTASFGVGRDATAGQSNPFTSGKWGTWVRAGGGSANADGKVKNLFTSGKAEYDTDHGFLQGGVSFKVLTSADAKLIASVFGQYGNSSSAITNGAGVAQGTIKTNSGGAGAGLSWLMTNGLYADLTGLATWHDIDTRTATGAKGSTDGNTLSGSAEVGFNLPVSEGFSVIPQAQIVYQRTSVDRFTDSAGTTVKFKNSDHVEGRIGLAFEHVSTMFSNDGIFKVNGSASIVHDFTNESQATVNATALGFDAKGTELLLSAGATVQPAVDGLKFGLQGGYHIPLNNTGREAYMLTGTVGWSF